MRVRLDVQLHENSIAFIFLLLVIDKSWKIGEKVLNIVDKLDIDK